MQDILIQNLSPLYTVEMHEIHDAWHMIKYTLCFAALSTMQNNTEFGTLGPNI